MAVGDSAEKVRGVAGMRAAAYRHCAAHMSPVKLSPKEPQRMEHGFQQAPLHVLPPNMHQGPGMEAVAAMDAHVAIPAYAVQQPVFWPPETIYLANLQHLILNQVHYYFSTENLCKDEFLRAHMDNAGWLPIPLLATFNRLRHLTTDVMLISEVLCMSPELEVRDGHVRKRYDWERWVFPRHQGADGTQNADSGSHVRTQQPAVQSSTGQRLPGSTTELRTTAADAEASVAPSTWRDAASKTPPATCLSSSQGAPQPSSRPAARPAPPAAAPPRPALAAAPDASVQAVAASYAAEASAQPARAAATERAAVQQQPAHAASPRPARALNRGDDGWETSKAKPRRRRTVQSADKLLEDSNQFSLEQLASVLPSGALQTERWNGHSDEHSDETVMPNDEDWSSSSAGSTDDHGCPSGAGRPARGLVPEGGEHTPTARPLAPQPEQEEGVPKGAASAMGAEGKLGDKAVEKPRGKPSKQQKLAQKAAPRASSRRRAGVSAQPHGANVRAVVENLSGAMIELCFAMASKALEKLSSISQAGRLHPLQLAAQALLCILVLLLLSIVPLSFFPATLPQLAPVRWLEIPAGIVLALKFNAVGSRLQSLCSPFPLSDRAA